MAEEVLRINTNEYTDSFRETHASPHSLDHSGHQSAGKVRLLAYSCPYLRSLQMQGFSLTH